MDNMLSDILKAIEVINVSYNKIREIETKDAFCALIGTIIDQWFADHDLSVEDAHEMLVFLTEAHKEVNDSLGELNKSILTFFEE